MNHHDSPPAGTTALRLARRSRITSLDTAGHGENATADLAALREREANLLEYEARLRTWQAQLDARAAATLPTIESVSRAVPYLRPSSQSPFGRDPELEEAWQKLHRASALLEAERNQLCDDRLKLRDAEAAVQRREGEFVARETRLTEREQCLAAATARQTAETEKAAASSTWNLTQAPFRAARAIFKSGA